MSDEQPYSQKSADIATPKIAHNLMYPDFLALYQQAMKSSDTETLFLLEENYPEYASKAYLEQNGFEADLDSKESLYPILCQPANFSPCVMNMVSFLIPDTRRCTDFIDFLFTHVKGVKRLNARTDEVYYVFEETSLWEQFFLKEPTLASAIIRKHIESFQELIYRTQDYFEQADPSFYPPIHF